MQGMESQTIQAIFVATNPENPVLVLLRGHLPELFFGPIFLFVGICACSVAGIRRRREFRMLLWFGLFIGMAGTRILVSAAMTFGLGLALPIRVDALIDSFLVVPCTLFWVEFSIGNLQRFMRWLAASGAVAGLFSVAWYATTGRPYKFIVLNSLIAIVMLLTIALVAVIPSLSRKYLVIQSRVLSTVLLLIAFAVVFSSALRALGRGAPPYVVPSAFAAWIIALGYVAVQRTFENERRLLTIESELEMARQIQFSILPQNVLGMPRLRIAASYHPMSAVAGDFYQFVELDEHRLGILIADVAGHGVPAALVAAMMKTAMQSVVSCAHSPRDVLQGLNRMLSRQGHNQFVTAAYLVIDSENYEARYSAAGHPPLFLSRTGRLQRIESNGLVFGVTREPDYPVREIKLCPGDRLLLYTDGVIEPENAKGEAFGGAKLEQVLLGSQMCPASELIDTLLDEVRTWQPRSIAQQDDITLIVVDVL
jgi:phosphoserine phosphatase RsbU/P